MAGGITRAKTVRFDVINWFDMESVKCPTNVC